MASSWFCHSLRIVLPWFQHSSIIAYHFHFGLSRFVKEVKENFIQEVKKVNQGRLIRKKRISRKVHNERVIKEECFERLKRPLGHHWHTIGTQQVHLCHTTGTPLAHKIFHRGFIKEGFIKIYQGRFFKKIYQGKFCRGLSRKVYQGRFYQGLSVFHSVFENSVGNK